MSKKIIYLLSLLMALSLVFASCKKSGITNPGGDLPTVDPGDNSKPSEDSVGGDGLFTDEGKLGQYADTFIQRAEIAKYASKDYKRNPVITVVNGSTVVIFYEVRYQSPGSGNDTALTGTNVVDIAYVVSTDGGLSFDNNVTPNYVGGKAGTIENSHGAPVVFYDKVNSQLIVVASAGIGLSVGSEGKGESRLEYSVATVGSDGSISGFNTWIPMDKPANLTKDNVTFTQFGTHSARGTIASDGKLLLPVTVGKFVNENGSWGNSRWGYLLYEGTVGSGTVTWTEVPDSLVVMKLEDKTKATRIASGTSQDSYVALTVSDASSPKLYQAAAKGVVPTMTGISAGDGAAGTLVVDKWVGGSYNPADYKNNTGNIVTKKQALLSHVEVLEKQLAIRLVNEDFTLQNGNSFIPNDAYKQYSKSSTLDMLADGTIVLVAEGGKIVENDDTRTFYIHFYRYSQECIAKQTGNAQ